MPAQRMKVIARRWPVLGLSDATCGVPRSAAGWFCPGLQQRLSRAAYLVDHI